MTSVAPKAIFGGGNAADAYRTAEGLPDFYRQVQTTVAWAENTRNNEWNTDARLGELGAYKQVRMECLDSTPVLIRDVTQWNVGAQPGRPYPTRFYIDVPLESDNPHRMTRVTLHGPHDDTPNVFTAERFIQREDGTALPQRGQLTSKEQDDAFESVRTYFEVCTELGGIAFVDSDLHNLRQSPDATEMLGDAYEAQEAQNIVDSLLAAEGVTAESLTLEKPAHFAVWDNNDFDNVEPLVIHSVTVRKLDDESHDTAAEIYFNRLEGVSFDRSDEPIGMGFCVLVTNLPEIFTTETRFFKLDPNPDLPDAQEPQLIALTPEQRRRVYAAMQQQLVLSGNVFPYPTDTAAEA